MTTYLDQTQRIGSNRGNARVCLWNRALADAGFAIGTPIDIAATRGGVTITPDPSARRRVSRVINHGNELPVIDLKATRSLDLSALGLPGESVRVLVTDGRIRITPTA